MVRFYGSHNSYYFTYPGDPVHADEGEDEDEHEGHTTDYSEHHNKNNESESGKDE